MQEQHIYITAYLDKIVRKSGFLILLVIILQLASLSSLTRSFNNSEVDDPDNDDLIIKEPEKDTTGNEKKVNSEGENESSTSVCSEPYNLSWQSEIFIIDNPPDGFNLSRLDDHWPGVEYHNATWENPCGVKMTNFSDEVLWSAVYNNSDKYPNHFYQEIRGNHSIYHENSVSLRMQQPHGIRINENTDNSSKALEWVRRSMARSSGEGVLIGWSESEKFYEFYEVRERPVWSKLSPSILLRRIYKTSYFDMTECNVVSGGSVLPWRLDNATTGILGMLKQTPIEPANVNEFAEYFYYLNTYNLGGSNVLSSFTEDYGGTVNHTIISTAVGYGDWGMHDWIHLLKIVYSVDKETGLISYSYEQIGEIQGKYHPNLWES